MLAALVAPAAAAPAQDARALAATLRPNTVRIHAVFDRGTEGEESVYGFGFIVGRDGDGLWIATAGHTVWAPKDGEPEKRQADEVRVTYYSAPGARPWARVSAHFDDSGYDLAFLVAEPLPEVRWIERSTAAESVMEGEQVVHIGRDLDWHLSPATVDEVEYPKHEIMLRGKVPFGSSGGPVVSEAGIVGMILTGTRVLPIHYGRYFARRNQIPWLLGPHQPSRSCEPFEVCFDRTDAVGLGRLVIQGVDLRASLADGACVTVAPQLRYRLKPDRTGLRCRPDGLTPICGMARRVGWHCEIDIEGTWRSTWGEVQFIPTLSGEYRFFGFADGPRVVPEGKAYVTQDGRLSLIDQSSAAPMLSQRDWRAELTLSIYHMSGTASIGTERLPLNLARGDAVLPAAPAPAAPAPVTAPAESTAGEGEILRDEKDAALRQARRFLELVDGRELRRAYRQTSASLRRLFSEEAFVAQISISSGPLGGKGEDRVLIDGRPSTQMPLPNAPPLHGVFYSLRFKTRYPAGPVYEDVNLEKEADGAYRVVGFYFYPAPAS